LNNSTDYTSVHTSCD